MIRYLETDKLITFLRFGRVAQWKCVRWIFFIRLMIDDELNIYIDYYEYKVDGNYCQ